MKIWLLIPIILVLGLLTSCSKDEDSTVKEDPTDTSTNEELTKVFQGVFLGQNGYPTSGTTILGTDKANTYIVRLNDDFSTSFATGSVTMYLSSTDKLKLSDSNTFIKLAVINKNGKHDFKLTSKPDPVYKYIIVWCAPAAIQFGIAELK